MIFLSCLVVSMKTVCDINYNLIQNPITSHLDNQKLVKAKSASRTGILNKQIYMCLTQDNARMMDGDVHFKKNCNSSK